jgi:GNAT superfamily N-acetyltransferase
MTTTKIVTYDELQDHNGFLLLMEAAFWWLVSPQRIAEVRKLDPRLRDQYGFGLLKGKELVGFVGVMDIPVKTRDGKKETAVGIHHVATHPAYSRQGISTRLFEYVHDYYRQRGYRFSFLFTSRSLVAWSLYCKLGYEDVPIMGKFAPRAEKIITPGKGRKHKIVTRAADLIHAERLFEEATANRVGFATRGPGWTQRRLKTWRMKRSNIIVERDGYAFTEPEREGIWISEFVARNRAAYQRILDRIMALGKNVIVDCLVYDPVLQSIYRQKRFRFRYANYGVLMAKPLADVSIRQAFGPHFFWTPVDQF